MQVAETMLKETCHECETKNLANPRGWDSIRDFSRQIMLLTLLQTLLETGLVE